MLKYKAIALYSTMLLLGYWPIAPYPVYGVWGYIPIPRISPIPRIPGYGLILVVDSV